MLRFENLVSISWLILAQVACVNVTSANLLVAASPRIDSETSAKGPSASWAHFPTRTPQISTDTSSVLWFQTCLWTAGSKKTRKACFLPPGNDTCGNSSKRIWRTSGPVSGFVLFMSGLQLSTRTSQGAEYHRFVAAKFVEAPCAAATTCHDIPRRHADFGQRPIGN